MPLTLRPSTILYGQVGSITHSPSNKLPSDIFLVCFSYHSAAISLK